MPPTTVQGKGKISYIAQSHSEPNNCESIYYAIIYSVLKDR